MATMQSETRQNVIQINGRTAITMANQANGAWGGWMWNGTALIHKGSKPMSFSAEMTAEINDVVGAYRAPRHETKYGFQIPAGDEGWEFAGVAGDAHGVYTKTTDAGSGTLEVWFGRGDLA